MSEALIEPHVFDHVHQTLQVYLTTLEFVKAACRNFCERTQMTAAQTATVCNGVGGAVASLATQSVIVPIDVVRGRLQAKPRSVYASGVTLNL